MRENPYTGLVALMRRAGQEGQPTVYRLGRVRSLTPLTVQAGELTLTGEDLLLNAGLLPNTRSVALGDAQAAFTALRGPLEGRDQAGQQAPLQVESGELAGALTFTGALACQSGALAVGDQVVLLTGDDQLHILLCKVVAG